MAQYITNLSEWTVLLSKMVERVRPALHERLRVLAHITYVRTGDGDALPEWNLYK